VKSHALHDQVDELVRRALTLPATLKLDEQAYLQAQLARYACLLACAAVEQALIDALASYARRAGDGRLEGFVASSLKTGANPSPAVISRTLGKFDPRWSAAITTYFKTTGESDINSIVSNRNRIAHGENASLGISSIRSWAPSARALSVEISRIVGS
jgi:hypothetical protein